MATALVWDGARYPAMGLNHTLNGVSPRPAALVGQPYSAQKMQEWRDDFGVDVVVAGSPDQPGVVAGYAADGDSEFAGWLADGYPCLRHPCVAKPRSLEPDPELIDSFETGVAYLAFMGERSGEAAATAQEYYADQGWKTETEALDSAEVWLGQFRSLFWRLALLVAVLVVLLTSGHVLTRVRTVGVQLLQGTPRRDVLVSDVVVWSLGVWSAGLVASAIVWLGFQILVDGHFVLYVLRLHLLLVAVYWVVGAVGLVAGHALLSRSGLLESLKGRLSFGLSFPLVYLLRSLVVILFGGLLMGLGQSLGDIRRAEHVAGSLGGWAAFSTYGVNTGAGDDRQDVVDSAREMTAHYARGDLVLSRGRELFFLTSTRFHEDGTLNLDLQEGAADLFLEVSPRYLDLSPVRLTSGADLRREDLNPDAVTLLLPEGTPEPVRRDLCRHIEDGLFTRQAMGVVPSWRSGVMIDERTVSADGNERFTMAGWPTVAQDPPLIVYPQNLILGEEFLFTGEGQLVRSAGADRIAEEVPSLGRSITGFEPLQGAADAAVEMRRSRLARELAELLGFLVVLPLTTVAAVLMYSRQHARRLFAQTITGRPLVELAPALLALDAITIVAIAWASRPQAASLQELRDFGDHALRAPLVELGVVLGLCALTLVAELMAFVWLQRRIVRERGGEE